MLRKRKQKIISKNVFTWYLNDSYYSNENSVLYSLLHRSYELLKVEYFNIKHL